MTQHFATSDSKNISLRFATCMAEISQSRSRAAFSEIFGFFAPRVKSFLIKKNCPAAQAEEITQDIMSTVWHKAHLYDPEKSSVSTWVFRIARNRYIDQVRQDQTHIIDPNDPTLFPKTVLINEYQVDIHKRDQRVRHCINALPNEQAALIQLSFFENKSHGEIARELDLPLGTVKSRMRLAFTHLRKNLASDETVDLN